MFFRNYYHEYLRRFFHAIAAVFTTEDRWLFSLPSSCRRILHLLSACRKQQSGCWTPLEAFYQRIYHNLECILWRMRFLRAHSFIRLRDFFFFFFFFVRFNPSHLWNNQFANFWIISSNCIIIIICGAYCIK